jgi:hypothetical protein
VYSIMYAESLLKDYGCYFYRARLEMFSLQLELMKPYLVFCEVFFSQVTSNRMQFESEESASVSLRVSPATERGTYPDQEKK